MLIVKDIERYSSLEGMCVIRALKSIYLVLTNPGLFAIVNYRFGQWILLKFDSDNKKYIRYFFNIFYYSGKKISVIWGKIDIDDNTPIGSGFFISNKGRTILGAESIGDNCTIESRVTIGLDKGKKPSIGSDVYISTNSVIYGDIRIGQGSLIRPDSILSKSVPDYVIVEGNPARIKGKYNKGESIAAV